MGLGLNYLLSPWLCSLCYCYDYTYVRLKSYLFLSLIWPSRNFCRASPSVWELTRRDFWSIFNQNVSEIDRKADKNFVYAHKSSRVECGYNRFVAATSLGQTRRKKNRLFSSVSVESIVESVAFASQTQWNQWRLISINFTCQDSYCLFAKTQWRECYQYLCMEA